LQNITDKRYRTTSTDTDVTLHYTKSKKDWFDILTQGAYGAVLAGFPVYLLCNSTPVASPSRVVAGFLIFIALMIWGTYKLYNSFKLLLTPGRSFLVIDKVNQQLKVKSVFLKVHLSRSRI
jgi:hypothetical protein